MSDRAQMRQHMKRLFPASSAADLAIMSRYFGLEHIYIGVLLLSDPALGGSR